jgi:prepilin-type processing-associated H-X9-DG protein
MKEFMMIFRMTQSPDFQPTAEQLQESIKHWQDWIGGIAAQGKIVNTNQLGFTGKTLKADGVITDGPYAEVKEIVGGYLIVRTENIDEAMTLAEGCPILFVGGHVEVREIMRLNP